MRAQKTCSSATASPRFAWQGSSKSSRSSTMPGTAFSSSRCRHPACRTGSVCRIQALSERQRRTGCQPSLRLRGTYHAALLDGECTVRDGKLFSYLKDLCNLEGIFLEPSACAGFEGISAVGSVLPMASFLEKSQLSDQVEQAVHIVWATGKSLVPPEASAQYLA